MRIAVVGGGPGGLYFAALTRQLDPSHEITVWERNADDDTFGFGVVFSDETLGGIEHADPAIHEAMSREFARWDDIDIHLPRSRDHLGRPRFCRDEPPATPADPARALPRARRDAALQHRGAGRRATSPLTHDLVVGADGVNSAARAAHAAVFRPTLDVRRCKFMWLGTDLVFDAFKFYIVDTPHGVMQIHGYPYDATGSTFIVEMNDAVWQRAGFAALAGRAFAPGESDLESIAEIRTLFAHILDGHAVHANNSKWISFTTVRNESWHDGNVVILGDAAHTAHFSIGSGTKLAMEDALALAACLHEGHSVAEALDAYEAERKPVVVSTQRAAQASLEWFENLGQYVHQDPLQFAFNILTRSRRVTYENLRLRDPEFVHRVDAWFAGQLEVQHPRTPDMTTPPMFQPFRLRGLELKNRVIVSAMDMYSADDGMPNDFHLVQTGGKALGGAGLVMTEMVCVSARWPHHTGLRGHVCAGARDRVAAHRRLRPRANHRAHRPPARALRAEGINAIDVGRHGRATPGRELGACGAVAHPIRRRQSDPPRAEPR